MPMTAAQIVGRHGQNRATAYLKERMGDYDGAYDILRKVRCGWVPYRV